MLPGEESCAWVSLTRAPALGVSALSMTLEILGSARAIPEASDTVRRAVGMPAAAREFLASAQAAATVKERTWLENPRHTLVPFTDPRYPALLRECVRYPLALYVVGNVDILNDPQLAVVGSRNPSAQGRDTAHDFSEHLANRGLAIVSGLAEGVDSAAHRGALASR